MGATGGPVSQRNLMFMELGAINSGKGKKYFIIDWDSKTGSPEHFKQVIKDNPIVQRLRAEGYVGPQQVAAWKGDLDTAIKDAMQKLPNIGNTYGQGAVPEFKKKIEKMQQAKKIIAAGNLEEDSPVDEKIGRLLKRSTLGRSKHRKAGHIGR